MSFRKYLVGIIAVFLLIWGPIDHSWPAWFLIRSSYLIIIPITVWFLLKWIWNKWQPNTNTENILERILASFVSCILIVLAIFEAIADSHIGNTQWIRTRDGMEAVGKDIIVPGADWSIVIILGFAAIFVFWFGVIKNNSKSSG